MTGPNTAADTSGAPPQPRPRWWGPLVGLLALAVLPSLPPTHLLIPIVPVTFLLLPALAACAMVAWLGGGSSLLGTGFVAWSAWIIAHPSASGSAIATLSQGWSLILAAMFGLVAWAAPGRAFFPKALAATGLAFVVATAVVYSGQPGGGAGIRAAVAGEMASRNDALFAAVHQELAATPPAASTDSTAAADSAGVVGWTALTETLLRATATAATTIFPALLAVESLCALALAWSLFQRLSRVRSGPPLARLREFRFNDQLVWGLALALTTLVLPTLGAFRVVGWNLLVFFGCLYALRGLGVVAWFVQPGRSATVKMLLGIGALILPVFAAVALGLLGVGDTWADWRRRARPSTLT